MNADTKLIVRQYWHSMRAYPRDLFLISFSMISAVLGSVILPLQVSRIVTNLVSHNLNMIPSMVVFVILAISTVLSNLIGIRSCMRLWANITYDLHTKTFEALMQRSVGFFNNQISGRLVSDAIVYEDSFGAVFNGVYLTLGGFFLVLASGLGIILWRSPILGLILAALMIVLALWSYAATKTRLEYRKERVRLKSASLGHMADSLVNAMTIKIFSAEQKEVKKSYEAAGALRDIRIRDWLDQTTNESYRMGLLLLMQVSLVIWLAQTAKNDPAALGTGIFAFTYTLALLTRFFNINHMVRQLTDTFTNAAPMARILEQSPEIKDADGAKALTVKHGTIDINDVRFQYADNSSGQTVFEGLNLAISAGEKVGLVGPSGGGKSTFTRLLLRFEDINEGVISIDKQDIARVTQTSLRQAMSYVPQEPLLFHRTVAENIGYGAAKASRQAIIAAAKKAYAHEFITALPEGYDTIVGERGVKLSGGQRQRVAIARAILKNAPILILDEATSALDSESEQAIQAALNQLMKGKTSLVIAHRLSTIQSMDRIIVMGDGKILEQGAHAQLLKRKGLYARLWQHQSGGFLED